MGGPVSAVQAKRQELQASTDRCAKQANALAFRLFCIGKGKTSTVEEKVSRVAGRSRARLWPFFAPEGTATHETVTRGAWSARCSHKGPSF